MSEFSAELTGRAEQALASLRDATAAGDDYLVGVLVGELQSLTRLADDHGIELAAVSAELERHGVPTDLELPEGEPSPTGPIVLDPDAAQQAPVA